MSWSGFKKNVGRATTQVMMKTGHVEKTSDREYEVEERRYRTLESASLRLQKEAKGYLDSLRAMTASQMRIAETIDAFYGESGAKDGVSRSYKQAVEDLDAETVKALDGPYRCVTQDPYLQSKVPFDEEEGTFQKGVLEEAEAELNWLVGNKRNYTRNVEEVNRTVELIEFVYRTTVLEPINRFCAYFPDINECIKKRNHKMLDYDSMRSKVKKLTEKPDKDPGKLPRTEKETEMVKKPFPRSSTTSDLAPPSPMGSEDLLFPSPPKVLDGLKHNQDAMDKIKAEENAALASVGLKRKSSVLDRLNRVGSLMGNAFAGSSPVGRSPEGRTSTSSTVASSPSPTVRSKKGSWALYRECASINSLPTLEEMLDEGPQSKPTPKSTPKSRPSPLSLSSRPAAKVFSAMRSFSGGYGAGGMVIPTSPASTYTTKRISTTSTVPDTPTRSGSVLRHTLLGDEASPSPRFTVTSAHSSDIPSVRSSMSSSKKSVSGPTFSRNVGRTALFHPSELEDIMAPLKQQYISDKTDELAQAKAAYEQLNQQLTDELPQLIDLRVPYLDPTFEALVKIQLRFCAEAYSRMAQVQQYLAAETRDQYASGDLDARVEDVLGQIRELSIAGTV